MLAFEGVGEGEGLLVTHEGFVGRGRFLHADEAGNAVKRKTSGTICKTRVNKRKVKKQAELNVVPKNMFLESWLLKILLDV